MSNWLNLGQIISVNARKFPNTAALREKDRALTYPELNRRVNKLAHSLYSLGLEKGDKVAVLLENSIEIVEVFLATAKVGLVIIPINFRLVGKEIEYIINNSDAKAVVVHDEFAPEIDSVKEELKNIVPDNYIAVKISPDSPELEGYREYEKFIADAPDHDPEVEMDLQDLWVLIYTSGTTGKPKGVLRPHEGPLAFYMLNTIDFGYSELDVCMNVMPLCHINSVFFSLSFLYIGASIYIHPARSFRAEEILQIIEKEKITFISLIPTHYNLILNISDKIEKPDIGSIRKLLCSSAPVSRATKKGVMEFFPGVELYEAYGSSEAGIVTILKPYHQIEKLGSIGFETLGTYPIKILDEDGNEVKTGEVGEIYSRSPMLFSGYYKMPEKTAASFRGEWFSAGDMGKKDEDGFYYIVDRKDNMIITGGEHVYPSEVEEVLSSCPGVFDAAVISLLDEKWGEKVVAVVIPKEGSEPDEKVLIDFCRDKLAAYKRPKNIFFIQEEEMPRTATGKILHRKLRDFYKS